MDEKSKGNKCPLSVSDWMGYFDGQKISLQSNVNFIQSQITQRNSLMATVIVYFGIVMQFCYFGKSYGLKFSKDLPSAILFIGLIGIFTILGYMSLELNRRIKNSNVDSITEELLNIERLQARIIDGDFGNDGNLIKKEWAKTLYHTLMTLNKK